MALNEFRSIYLPYCVERQADGSCVVLNREYKPVGFNTREYIDYDKYPVSARLQGLTDRKLQQIAFDGEVQNGRAYLYNDGCVPTSGAAYMKAYLGRLSLLAKLKVKRA